MVSIAAFPVENTRHRASTRARARMRAHTHTIFFKPGYLVFGPGPT